MPEGAVLCETMNGEQNLNEKWLFISLNQKKIKRGAPS